MGSVVSGGHDWVVHTCSADGDSLPDVIIQAAEGVASTGHMLQFRAGATQQVAARDVGSSALASRPILLQLSLVQADVAHQTIIGSTLTWTQRMSALLSAVMSLLGFTAVPFKSCERVVAWGSGRTGACSAAGHQKRVSRLELPSLGATSTSTSAHVSKGGSSGHGGMALSEVRAVKASSTTRSTRTPRGARGWRHPSGVNVQRRRHALHRYVHVVAAAVQSASP